MATQTPFTAESASAALNDTTYTRSAITTIPTQCVLTHLQCRLSATGSSATCTWYLSQDAAGDYRITDIITSTLDDPGAGTNLDGFAAILEDLPWKHGATGDVDGTVYINAKVDAGTPALVAIIRGIER